MSEQELIQDIKELILLVFTKGWNLTVSQSFTYLGTKMWMSLVSPAGATSKGVVASKTFVFKVNEEGIERYKQIREEILEEIELEIANE